MTGAARAAGRGTALRGRLWCGGASEPVPDGVLVVDPAGRVVAAGPADQVGLPQDLVVLGGAGCWVGPGLIDAHVHLAFGSAPDAAATEAALAGGVVALRDLGAPPADALRWRSGGGPPVVAVAGPVLTAPGGYPSLTWGAAGFATGLADPAAAAAEVARLASSGVDLIKIAFEPAGDAPVPTRAVAAAVVRAAHDHGLAVTAHALTARMVARALDAGVDELCHTPVEELPPAVLGRLVAAGVVVVSTLQTLLTDGDRQPARTAAALHAAGVPLVYGTDLGNAGTHPGADPRELDRLADAGLGRQGALRAATDGAAAVAGLRGRAGVTGRLTVGEPAAAVLLSADPLEEPQAWRVPLAVVAGGRVLRPPVPDLPGERTGPTGGTAGRRYPGPAAAT